MDKINAELVILTYGTLIAQLARDFDGNYQEVNNQLDKMGYNIGVRLIEDYLAKSNATKRCATFRDTAEMIAKVSLLYVCPFCYCESDHLLNFLLAHIFIDWLQNVPKCYSTYCELVQR